MIQCIVSGAAKSHGYKLQYLYVHSVGNYTGKVGASKPQQLMYPPMRGRSVHIDRLNPGDRYINAMQVWNQVSGGWARLSPQVRKRKSIISPRTKPQANAVKDIIA
jgi:hypothetical protein